MRRDIVIAAILTVVTQVELWTNDGVEDPFAVQVASFALMTVPLAWRRAAPLAAGAAVSLGFAAQTILAGDAPVVGGLIAAILITYSVAAYTEGRDVWLGAAFVTIGVVLSALWDEDKRSLGDTLGNLLIFGVIFALGRVVRARQERADTLEVSVREHEERARRAVAEERARIARELHDVIAHNVSAMVLQAGAARQVLDTDPARVRDPLLSIEHSGREAIAEMRRLLGILRENGGALSLAPQPGVDRLDELAEQARAAGLTVDLRVEGDPTALPTGLALTAYRVVQEALTNAMKHAGPAHVDVSVQHDARELVIDVADDGRGAHRGFAGGLGLIGMRERVSVYGGRLEAGPRPEGGFRVSARLPVTQEGP
jgi:signal transduction histidine kinase